MSLSFSLPYEILVNLSAVKSFTIVVSYTEEVYKRVVRYITSILTTEGRIFLVNSSLLFTSKQPEANFVFLCRTSYWPQIISHCSLGADVVMGRAKLAER